MPRDTFHVVDRVDAYLHDLLDGSLTAYVEEHCGRCAMCEAAMAEARKRKAAFAALPPAEASEELIVATMEAIEHHDEADGRRRRLTFRAYGFAVAATVLLLGGLHLYYLMLTPGTYELAVLGQQQLLAGAGGSLRVRVLDRKTGQGVANVPVRIELRDEHNNLAELARFTTDAQGTGQPRFQTPDWNSGEYTLRVVANPGWFGGDNELTERVRLRRSWKIMLTSDKPVYQPGQLIHLRALGLRKPDLKPVAAQEALFTIADPKGTVIFKRTDLTSKFGIAAADCPLAGEVNEGPYTIGCKVGDTETKLVVEVKRYVLPKFKIDLALDKPWYQPGQRVRGAVQADYFYGKPVADSEVALRAESIEGNAKVLFDQKVKTDAKGHAEFEFPLPEGADIHGRIGVQATVTDSARQKQERMTSAPVSAEVLRVEAIPEVSGLVRGVPNKVYVYATYPDGSPAAKARIQVAQLTEELTTNELGTVAFMITSDDNAISLTIKAGDDQGNVGRKTLRLDSNGHNGDFLVRTDKAVYDGGENVTIAARGPGSDPVFLDVLKDGQTMLTEVVAMQNGKGATAFTLPAELFGTIELVAYRWQPGGTPLRRSRVLYVRQASAVSIAAKLDRTEYRPGGKAKLNLALTTPDGKAAPGAVSLAAVDEAVFAVLGQPTGMEKAYYGVEQRLLKPVYELFPWSPDAGKGKASDARVELELALFSRTARIDAAGSRPAADSPTTTLQADNYEARARAITQARRSGLATLRTAWVVALALLFGAVLVHCCVVCRPWLIVPRMLTALENAARDREQARLLAELESAGRTRREPESSIGCMPLAVAFSFLLVLFLASIQILGRNANSAFGTVGASIGSTVSGGGGGIWAQSSPVPESRPRMAEQVQRELEVPAVVKVPLPVPQPNPEEEPAQPLRLRDFFPETLLWRPQVITDDDGNASLDIDLADSITTWRLSASAITTDGRLGATSAPVTVFQPFFVDLNLPVSLTRGDEVTIPAVVSSYLRTPQTVTLELKPADWYQLAVGEEATRTVEIKPGEKVAIPFTLKVKQVGQTQPLVLEARAGKVADAVKRVVEVVPDGRKVEQVINGALHADLAQTLTLPNDAIPGSPKLMLKFYATPFATLVEGLDNIFRMPSGCFEQTSSTTYPNVLALDYLKRTGKSVPNVEAKARQYIHLGYQRLLTFEVRGGGFDWFGRPPANRTLTAYGLMEFRDMAKVHDVDPALIERTRAWLVRQQLPSGAWPTEHRAINVGGMGNHTDLDYTTTAYITWAAFDGTTPSAESQAARRYLLRRMPAELGDPYVIALAANALLATEPGVGQAAPYLEHLASLKRTSADGKLVWWESAPNARTTFYGYGQSAHVETTALAVLALTRGNHQAGLARPALAWLARQKDAHGTWHSTQATVLALKALLAGTDLKADDHQSREIEISVGDALPRKLMIEADQADVVKQLDLSALLKPGANVLKVREKTAHGTACQVAFRYHTPTAEQNAGPLALALDYERTEVTVGDALRVTARLTNRAKETSPMVMLSAPVPAGFSVDVESLQRHITAGTIERYQLTGSGILVYLRELAPGKTLELPYTLLATLPAQVTAGPGRVYEYYDPAREALTTPVKLSVARR